MKIGFPFRCGFHQRFFLSQPQETYDKWDVINVKHVVMNREEAAEALAEVKDPMYLLGRTELDAEGEVVDDTQMDLMEAAIPVTA